MINCRVTTIVVLLATSSFIGKDVVNGCRKRENAVRRVVPKNLNCSETSHTNLRATEGLYMSNSSSPKRSPPKRSAEGSIVGQSVVILVLIKILLVRLIRFS